MELKDILRDILKREYGIETDAQLMQAISFGLGLGWAFTPEGRMNLIGMMIGQYLLKACLALADTPFFYFFTRREVTEHGNEYQENAACRS